MKIRKKFMVGLIISSLVIGMLAISAFAAEKKIKIKVWGGPPTTYPSVEKMLETTDAFKARDLYEEILFEATHSGVDVVPITWDMWSKEAGRKLMSGLASGEAPCLYYTGHIGGVQTCIGQGLVADITDLWNAWPPHTEVPAAFMTPAMKDGHVYAIPQDLGMSWAVNYRKDWLESAGVFNAEGKPAPPKNWTWTDYATIMKKITDPKKGTYGGCLPPFLQDMIDWEWDAPVLRPDPTGKYTWRANFDSIEKTKLFKMWHDMIYVDKSVMTGADIWYGEINNAFKTEKCGTLILKTTHLCAPDRWRFGKPSEKYPRFQECVGITFLPAMPDSGGMVPNTLHTNLFAFNPTISKEELKTAFDYYIWHWAGEGRSIYRRMRALVGYAPYWQVIPPYAENRHAPGLPPFTELFPPEYIKVNQEMANLPNAPRRDAFGLSQTHGKEFGDVYISTAEKILCDPNYNTVEKITKALQEGNKLADETALNYKIKGQTMEDFKKYYTALGEFYEKNWPEYYKNYWYPQFEKSYKVW